MFAYYANGLINCFATKFQPSAEAKTFSLIASVLDAFVSLKSELLEVACNLLTNDFRLW